MATQIEAQAMRRAIDLADSGIGTTSPNPVVGAVVLDSTGKVVGEGAHIGGPGNPHAEVRAEKRRRGGPRRHSRRHPGAVLAHRRDRALH